MDKAFRELGASTLEGTDRLHPDWELVQEYPLTEHVLAVVHAWRPEPGGDYVVAAKGAPEAVAGLCRLGDEQAAALAAQVEAATAEGQRVLAVAIAAFPPDEPLPEDPRGFAFTFLGLAGLHDPVRPGVAAAVAECARAGVRTVMITGDYPGTALAIAREIGLDAAAGSLTGPELRAMDDAELARRVGEVNVFARMVPEQKLQLIRALRANREVVAMTGDGVNDAPALRAADIGIAMGRRGTDVAREAADLVITDDDFASIVRGVRRGRGIFANLRKATAYVLAVHLPIVGMSLVPVFVPGWPLVLLPVQIAFLELIIDPACSVVFESEEIDPRIMEHPPRPLDEPLFRGRTLAIAALQGVGVFAAVLGVYLWALGSGRPDADVRSLAFAALVVGNLALILVNRSWTLPIWASLRARRNPTVKWILAGATALLILLLIVPALRAAFRFGALAPLDALVVVGAGLAGVAWFEVYKVVRAARAPRGRADD